MTKNLREYLAYYQELKDPGYAVLVTGEWGVGKTHQVRQCIKENDFYYVSLFGLRSASEAHAAVYAAYAPTLKKIKQILGAAGDSARSLGGDFSFGGVAADWFNAAIRQKVKPDRTLIFDDLERCGMSLEEMMGVFSTYVEQLGFRVVLIADEERLKKKHTEYEASKEKIIGHILKVYPNTSDAFDAFICNIDDKYIKYINNEKSEVLDVFKSSGCMSLRVLRHLIFDLVRLLKALRDDHIQNIAAMKEIIRLFVSFGIEIRVGRLRAVDLMNRRNILKKYEFENLMREKKGEVEPPPFVAAARRYPTIDLESQVFSDKVLEDIFEYGAFDPERIAASVDGSSHFAKRKSAPPWKIVANFDELTDEDLDIYLNKMEDQFKNREITSSGEMLHIFSLRLMMSEREIICTKIEDTMNDCIKYIDDLLDAGRLPPRELDCKWKDSFGFSYEGYGYFVIPGCQDQFNTIKKRLIEARESALEAMFPRILAELLAELTRDGTEFYRLICQTAKQDSPYALIPVFKCSDPVAFVDAWLSAPRPVWHWVKRALEDRLELHRVQNELASERIWALNVLREMEKRRDELAGFERLRVERIIPTKLKQLEEQHTFDEQTKHEN